MIPEQRLSTTPVIGSFSDSFYLGSPLKATEWGGVDLNDASKGLLVKPWTIEYKRQNGDVLVSAYDVAPVVLFNRPNITEVSLAFDRNMQPVVAFVQAGQAKLYFYDSQLPGFTFWESQLGAAKNPRVTHDDKRDTQSGIADVILAYVVGTSLRYRQQRERYGVERTLKPNGVTKLYHVGMSSKLRLQFLFEGSGTPQDPFLADIVKDLCTGVGISQENLDVNDLYNTQVVGYLDASDEGVSKALEPLSNAFFFDPTEYDRRLSFFNRGRDAVARFTYADLLDINPNAMKQTRVDETKLPKRVDVNHIDPAGGFAKNKQSSYRKSNLVNAKGNETLEFARLVLSADQAATIALKYIKMKWHEPMTYEWALSIAFSAIVPTDVVEYLDRDGTIHRLRIEERNEADGVIKFKGKTDGGANVYGTRAQGLSLPPPISTTPGIVGETRLEILNLPPLRDQDDELGVYVAMAGDNSAWYGASLEVSTDGGLNYVEAFQNEIPATLGDSETELLEELDPDYPSDQSFVVKTNFQLESVDRDTLLTNYNRAVIGDEVIQFQSAVHLGDNRYRLSGLIRGRYNTKPEYWPAGTRFVLIDTSLVFLQAQQWMLGKEIYFKPISFATDGEDGIPTAYDYDVAYSQLEWPPTLVTATRDGADAVAVAWVGRGRLGVEASPYNGKYFTGYKVKFSDGFEATVGPGVLTYTRTSTPAGVTVQVCGLNSITGDGEYSEAIST